MKRPCPRLCEKFQVAMDVLAKPWNGLVIATLDEGPLRFGELGERIETIGDRMLSCRLKELEAQGLVVRRVLAGPPVHVEYALTEVGQGFHQVAQAIGRWGEMLTGAASPTAASASAATPPAAAAATTTTRARGAKAPKGEGRARAGKAPRAASRPVARARAR
jgi:DNA-binding HxlR family transcriptional regulator